MIDLAFVENTDFEHMVDGENLNCDLRYFWLNDLSLGHVARAFGLSISWDKLVVAFCYLDVLCIMRDLELYDV